MIRGDLHQLFGQVSAHTGQEVVAVEQLATLVLNLLDVIGMAVAHVCHQHPATPVEKLVAVHIGDDTAFGLLPHQRHLIAHGLRLKRF